MQETAAKNIKNHLKSSSENKKIEEIKRKPMHGQFYQDPERPSVDKEKSLVWLCSSGLKGETESLITTAQDRALNMHYHQTNIMKQPTDSKCGICNKTEEHTKHIVAGCTTLVPSEYTNRHNMVAVYFHWMIYKHTGLQVTDKYYNCTPEVALNVNSTTIMWDVPVITD